MIFRLGGSTSDRTQFFPDARRLTERRMLFTLIDLWKRSSLQLHGICEANGIIDLHVLQSNLYLPGSRVMNAEENNTHITLNSVPRWRSVESTLTCETQPPG